MATFPERLKELRGKANLLQKELAEKLNIKRSTIGSWESGNRVPELSAAEKLADFFGVTTDYLLGRDIVPKNTRLDDTYPDPAIARLLKDNKIKLLETAKDLTYEELKLGIELARTIKREKALEK